VLRHTFATDLYQRTRDVFLVKEALGHRSIESTLVYVRSDRERLREVVTSGAGSAVG
jgi:integrase/recombinase XerD